MNTQAQTNQNWAPIGAKWCYEPQSMGGDDYYIVIESVRVDTFQNKQCQVLKETNFVWAWNGPGRGYTRYIFTGPEYKTYEDSGKVYCWVNNKFYKMYDFASAIGNEWTIWSSKNNRCLPYGTISREGKVKKTTSGFQSISGQMLKTYETDTATRFPLYNYPSKTIERIGSLSYIFGIPVDTCRRLDFTSGIELFCYTEVSGFQYRNNSLYSRCDSLANWVGVNEEANIPNTFRVYPNPFGEELLIEPKILNHRSGSGASLKIYNVLGQLQHQQMISNLETNTTMRLNTSDWAKSIYFLQIEDQQNLTIFKTKIIKE